VGEAATGEEAVALARRVRPDVVLIDACLPGLDSVEATRRICADAVVAVMLRGNQGDERIFAALRAGARGLLPEDSEPAELLSAVEALARGEPQRSPSHSGRLITELTSGSNPAGQTSGPLDRQTARPRKEVERWRQRFDEDTAERPLIRSAIAATQAKAVHDHLTTADTGSRAPVSPRALTGANADETRRRIERALHDGTQQRLVTLALEVQALKNAVPSVRPDLLAQLSHIADGLRAALEELREIARGVHPAILSEGGLSPALKSLARHSALPVELELSPMHRFPEPVEVAVYYIVSEALANTVKHAEASFIHVRVTAVDHALHLTVRDDGAGGADPNRGSGLVGLKDRVQILGGTITVQSRPGAGTTLHAELPLEG
jgi:signal transduction histidine kinase